MWVQKLIGWAFLVGCLLSQEAFAKSKCASDTEAILYQRDDAVEDKDENLATGNQDIRSQSCGRQSDLISGLKRGAQSVKLRNGKSFTFYPLLLTDKAQWACSAIKVRVACVDPNVVEDEAGVKVTLRTRANKPFTEETFTVTNSGAVIYPSDGRFFAIVPKVRRIAGQKQDVGQYALDVAVSANCGGPLPCNTKRLVVAERTMLEVIRTDRLPRTVSRQKRKEHVVGLLDKFADRAGDELILHRAIILNELGIKSGTGTPRYSPFEVLDAVYGRSGPSFGAHQIDMATNDSDDRIPFRRVLARSLSNHADLGLRALVPTNRADAIDRLKGPLEKPIREYNIQLFAQFYRAVPVLNEGFDGSAGQNDYFEAYDKFLRTSSDCMAYLRVRSPILAQSAFLRVYIMDVTNHFGPSVGSKMAGLAMRASNYQEAEKVVLKYIREDTAYGRSRRSDVDRRIANIRTILDEFPDRNGGDPKSCKMQALKAL